MQAIADIATNIRPSVGSWEPSYQRVRFPTRVRLDDLDTSHPAIMYAVQQARAWAERKRTGYEDASLILSGPYGTGKTHIAKSILWSMILEPDGQPDAAVPAGRFFMANDLLLKMSSVQDGNGLITSARVGDIIGTAPLVVIDDVGGQQTLPYVAAADQEQERHARYFRFVDYCYTVQTSLIITTNLNLGGGHKSALAQHIGGRSWDRLCEMAPVGFMVGLDSVPSWRVKSGGR